MKVKVLRSYVLLLVALVMLTIGCSYIPHHHHDGRVCVETTADDDPHGPTDREGHAEQWDISLPRLSAETSVIKAVFTAEAPSMAEVPRPRVAPVVAPVSLLRLPGYTCGFKARTQRLRGSPIFS